MSQLKCHAPISSKLLPCHLWLALLLFYLVFAGGIQAAPSINTPPKDLTVQQGALAVFSVSASGSGTLGYQWTKGNLPIVGATSAAHVIEASTYDDAGDYAVEITDSSAVKVTTKPATLLVGSPKAGDVDLSFGSDGGINGQVSSIAVQNDGKIVIGGTFTKINQVTRNYIARLNADGTTDHNFGNGLAGTNFHLDQVAVQSDGKILIAGNFATVNGSSRGKIARLNRDGSLDPTFASNLNVQNGWVNSIKLLSDGKVLISGYFDSINDIPCGRIARLNSNGSLDSTFALGLTGANDQITAMAVAADGKISIGGYFTFVNGLPRVRIARLHADGSLDAAFGAGLSGCNNIIRAIAAQADGKVVIGGDFTTINGVSRKYLARLQNDGSLDTTYGGALGGADANPTVMTLQPDGKVLVGGYFTAVNGQPWMTGLARLNTDGSLDTGFGAGMAGINSHVSALTLLADGSLYVGGNFTVIHGTPKGKIARLNANGSLFPEFGNGMSGINWNVNAIQLTDGGKVIVAGQFTYINGIPRGGVARLNSDGTLDTTFANGLAGVRISGINDTGVYFMAIQSDGKILIGGSFSSVNGVARRSIARLNGDGTLDADFGDKLEGATGRVSAITLQPDGKILIGGGFDQVHGVGRNRMARLNSNGTLDRTFGEGLAGATGGVRAIVVQEDGKIIAGGEFRSFHGAPHYGIVRMNATGTLDSSFSGPLPLHSNSAVFSIALQKDGKALIAGWFSTATGAPRNRIARLNTDGSLDAGFGNAMTGADYDVDVVRLQEDGKVLIGGQFSAINGIVRKSVARLNTNGSLDSSFGNTTNAVRFVKQMAVQSDGKVLICGFFTEVSGAARAYAARLHDSDADVDLTTLATLPGPISPRFSAGRVAYTTSYTGSAFSVIAVSSNPQSQIQVRANGGPYANIPSGQYTNTPPLGIGANLVDVKVTSPDKAFIKTYTITVTGLPRPPVVSNLSVHDITEFSATFQAAIPDNGGANISARGFVYCPASLSSTPIVNQPGVSQVINDLSGDFRAITTHVEGLTEYTVRAYATNSAGTTYSGAVTFRTTSCEVGIEMTAGPSPVARGGQLLTTIIVGNSGPSPAIDVTASTVLPASLAFSSVILPQGWTATTPNVGASGLLTFTKSPLLEPGTADTIVIITTVTPATPQGTILHQQVTVTSGTESDLSNNLATVDTPVGSAPVPLQLSNKAKLNKQTGLFEIEVNVTNTTPVLLDGFRLNVDYSAYLKAHPTLKFQNPTGTYGKGKAYVDYRLGVGVGKTVNLKLSFYTRNRKFPARFGPKLSVSILEPSLMTKKAVRVVAPQVAATPPDQASRLKVLADQTVELDFPATPGRWYRIEYSDDFIRWRNCPMPVQATDVRLRWIDCGPPTTDSLPAKTPTRFYRTMEIGAPPNP